MNISTIKSKKPGVTLKEYMFGHDLKKRISSKSKSREHKNENNSAKAIQELDSTTKIRAEQLLVEIKLKMRQSIVLDQQFFVLNRMIDRLSQLYKSQIQVAQRNSSILEQIALTHSNPNTGTQFGQGQFIRKTNNHQTLKKTKCNDYSKYNFNKIDLQGINKSTVQTAVRSANQLNRFKSNISDESIPVTNILLETRIKELQTKQTQESIDYIKKSPNQLNDSISSSIVNPEASDSEFNILDLKSTSIRSPKKEQKDSEPQSQIDIFCPKSSSIECKTSLVLQPYKSHINARYLQIPKILKGEASQSMKIVPNRSVLEKYEELKQKYNQYHLIRKNV